jgi:hypothetical protein
MINRLKEEVRTGKKTSYDAAFELGLTPRQTKFAHAYAESVAKRFRPRAYEIAYQDENNPDKPVYDAKNKAKRLIKSPAVQALISIIYASAGLTDVAVDTALMEIIHNKDGNEVARVMAIKLFNEMTGRAKGQVVNIQVNEYDFSKLSYEEKLRLEEMLQKSAPKDGE